MYISAKAEYVARALLTLAAAGDQPVKGEVLAREQGLPFKFLENTLVTVRQAGLIRAQRGPDGGYQLARPAASITIADVLRLLDGPLADVRGEKPEEAVYEGPAAHLQDVWIAVRVALRDVLESVTLAHIIDGKLPPNVAKLLDRPGAWERREPGPAAVGAVPAGAGSETGRRGATRDGRQRR